MRKLTLLLAALAVLAACSTVAEAPACRGDVFNLNTPRAVS